MALAFIPRLDIPPVIGGNHVEGGVAVPFAIKLSKKAELETMTEYDFIHNDTGSGYHVEYLNSASLYDAIGTQNPLGGIVTLDTGVVYKFGHDGHSISAAISASRAPQIASMPLSACRSAFEKAAGLTHPCTLRNMGG
jgi:hypothetical protein